MDVVDYVLSRKDNLKESLVTYQYEYQKDFVLYRDYRDGSPCVSVLNIDAGEMDFTDKQVSITLIIHEEYSLFRVKADHHKITDNIYWCRCQDSYLIRCDENRWIDFDLLTNRVKIVESVVWI